MIESVDEEFDENDSWKVNKKFAKNKQRPRAASYDQQLIEIRKKDHSDTASIIERVSCRS